MRRTWLTAGLMCLSLVAAACSGSTATDTTGSGRADIDLFADRLEEIGIAIAAWRIADSVEEALVQAETAANLVVGPNGPGYGDRNGDGALSGASDVGLLPGLDGTPGGLAAFPTASDCIVNNVLGGSWDEPAGRWQQMVTAIDTWQPDNNTMPSLASHPMRIVGWASFSLVTDSLDMMKEYAGHATLHVNISQRALNC